MALSYSFRLACLIAASLGLLQIAFELLLAAAAPVVLRLAAAHPLRQRERVLYGVQLTPLAFAVLFSAFLCRQYLATETNFASEAVGWPCVALSAAVLCWWCSAALAGIRIALRTLQFTRACRRSTGGGTTLLGGTEIVVATDATPRIALVGFVRPFVLMSQSLLEERGFPRLALEVVMDHERSHALQLDNWKLLSLYCLPRLRIRVAGGRTWMQHWQLSAEWAADEDAVSGSEDRALVLAETLVALARCASTRTAPLACTHLDCTDMELALRVARLIEGTTREATRQISRWTIAFGLLLVAAVAFVAHLAALAGDIPEHLLHLG
jgi:hypothetical protein